VHILFRIHLLLKNVVDQGEGGTLIDDNNIVPYFDKNVKEIKEISKRRAFPDNSSPYTAVAPARACKEGSPSTRQSLYPWCCRSGPLCGDGAVNTPSPHHHYRFILAAWK